MSKLDYKEKGISLLQGDCLERMKEIPDGCVDLVLTDPPYGTTACKWDTVIDLDKMWIELKRITKLDTAIVLHSSQPFTSALIMSNPKMFKYEWVWDKINKFSGHLNAKKQPMRRTERIDVFCQKSPKYFPQMEDGEPYSVISSGNKSSNYGSQIDKVRTVSDGKRYPRDVIQTKGDERGEQGRIHPTQKPLALMEYLIKTYTNENELVVDFTMGSGSTGVAAKQLNRKFGGIELDEKYFEIAKQRICAAEWGSSLDEPQEKT